MKKRILSMLLIVALLVVALIVTAQAENPTMCPCGCGVALDSVTWTSWDGSTDLTASGHYQLTAKSTKANETFDGIKVVLDLNGYQLINLQDGQRPIKLTNGAELYVMSRANTGGKGGEIVSSCSYGGGAIYVDGDSSLSIYSGTIRPYKASISATSGMIHCKSGSVSIYGGTITGQGFADTATANGGAIYMLAGDLTISGGTITGGDTKNGGAVYFTGTGTFKMDGGTVKGGSASSYGGAVALMSGSAELTGGTIEAGTCTTAGNGESVYIAADCTTVTLGGNLQVPDATKGNIFVGGEANLTISGSPYLNGLYIPRSDNTHPVLNTGSNARIFLSEPVKADALTFAAESTADAATCVENGIVQAFAPDQTLSYNEGLVFGDYDCPCCDSESITWEAWTGTPEAGKHYYLTNDGTYDAQTSFNTAGDYTLNLNGHTLEGSTTRFAAVSASGVTLNIVDSGASGTLATTYSAGNGGLFNVTNGVLKLYDGTFKQTKADFAKEGAIAQSATSGTIYVLGDAVLDASAVTGNSALRSALVCKKTAYIQGGTILANGAGNSVYALDGSTLSVSGGDIQGDLIVGASDTVTISGAPTVANVRFVTTGHTINIENLTENASIGVEADGAFTATANDNAAAWVEAGYIYSNVQGKVVTAEEGILKIVEAKIECPSCGESLSASEWKQWVKGTTPTESGHYYFTGSDENMGQTVIEGEINICLDLRGNTYNATGYRAFIVKGGAKLSIGNSANSDGTVKASHSNGAIHVQADSAVALHSGVKIATTDEKPIMINAESNGTVTFAEGMDCAYMSGKIQKVKSGTNNIQLSTGAWVIKDYTNVWYATAQEAVDNFGDTDYVRLLEQATVKLVNEGVVVNLNGYNLTVDSDSTAKLKVVSFKSTLTEADAATVTADAEDIEMVTRYGKAAFIALEGESGYTVHKLELKLSAVTLRTNACGFYYKAMYECDSVLQSKIDSYGVVLSVYNMPGDNFETETADINRYTAYDGKTFVSGEEVTSGAVFGIMKEGIDSEDNAARAMKKVYANSYVKIDDQYIMSDCDNVGKTAEDENFTGVAKSLFDVMQSINEKEAAGELDEDKLTLINTFKQNVEDKMGVRWPVIGEETLEAIPFA